MIYKSKHIILLVIQLLALNLFAIDANKIIEKANDQYNRGLYDSAIVNYQYVIDNGLEAGELFYNMGNTHYKNNDLASSILYYEKAKKLLPNDESIEYNLNIANSMIVDKIEKVPELFYQRWWTFFYNMLDTNTGAILTLILFALFIISIGFFILSQTRNNRKLTFYLSLFLLLLIVVSTTLTWQRYNNSLEQKEAIVFVPSITIKSSPTQNAVDLFVIHEGTKVKIMDKIDNWLEIKINNGSKGWLPEKSIREI